MSFLKKFTQKLAGAAVSKEEVLDVVDAILKRIDRSAPSREFRNGVMATFVAIADEVLERKLVGIEISEAVKNRMEAWDAGK